MTPDVPWQTLAGPTARWLLRRLPTLMLRRYYNAKAFENHLKIRLDESGTILTLAKGLVAPSLEINGEVFNLSPYLDLDVKAVRSFLSYMTKQEGDVFAEHDDFCGFEVHRGTSCRFQFTYRLNQFQWAVLSSCLERHIPIGVSVYLDGNSRIGVVRPFNILYISNPTLKDLSART